MNILYGFIEIIVVFSLLVVIEKLFKKEGLYVWLSIATILANITVCKMVGIFNITTSLGNVLFGSTFLATDIMSEKYSKKDAKKGVYLSVFSGITFIIVTQLALLFIPSSDDVVNGAMKESDYVLKDFQKSFMIVKEKAEQNRVSVSNITAELDKFEI